MSDNPSPHQKDDDTHADVVTFYWVVGFMAAFLAVDILSAVTEQARNQSAFSALHFSIYQTTSVVILLALYPVVVWVTSRASPGHHRWPHVIGAHAAASVGFSLVHIALMVALRKLIFSFFLSSNYIFTDNLLRDIIYEYRKDLLTYTLFVFFITFGRQLAQQRRELAAAREDARTSRRLTLKCGGRTIWVDASEVMWVKSAANYVEVAVNGKIHLARATLGSIEKQLADASADAVRVHRSYIVNAAHVAEARPTGEGDVKIEMKDGTLIPGSRRYRDRLPASS